MKNNSLEEALKEIEEERPDLKQLDDTPKKPGLFENNNRYYILNYDKEGKLYKESLSNFLFQNVRKIKLGAKEEALLVDISEGNQLRTNIIITGEMQADKKKLLIALKNNLSTVLLTCRSNTDFEQLMVYVAKQAKITVDQADYVGMFYHSPSRNYYFVILDEEEQIHYLKPSKMKESDGELVQVLGRRHLNSQTRIRNEYIENNWHDTAKTMLESLPKLFADKKALVPLAWYLAALLSDWMMEEYVTNLPILYLYGEKGAGKSTCLKILSTYFGNTKMKELAMSSTKQPIRDAMACTNAFPITTTESPNKKDSDDIANMLKILFDRSDYMRGNLFGNETYVLQAPWAMAANKRISNEAVQDRMIQLEFKPSDQSGNRELIIDIIGNKKDNGRFIAGYLQYLIKQQECWADWHASAKTYAKMASIPREAEIMLALAMGFVMMRDLQVLVGMEPYTDEVFREMMELVSSQRKENQIQPIYVEFLQFVQTYHIDPSYQQKQMSGWSSQKGFKFQQAWWLDKFEEYTQNKSTIDFDRKIILSGLKKYESIELNTSESLNGGKAKCFTINAQKLEEETEGMFPAEAWSKNALLMVEQAEEITVELELG